MKQELGARNAAVNISIICYENVETKLPNGTIVIHNKPDVVDREAFSFELEEKSYHECVKKIRQMLDELKIQWNGSISINPETSNLELTSDQKISLNLEKVE